jgi:hypothetical protein
MNRRLAADIAACALLLAQFLLGMAVDLEVVLPVTRQDPVDAPPCSMSLAKCVWVVTTPAACGSRSSRGLDAFNIGRHRDIRAASELATGRNTPMTMQILYASLIALGILISIAVALTLSVEGASALWVRDQMRVLLERSRVTSPTRTPSTRAAQLKTATEDARVIVVR